MKKTLPLPLSGRNSFSILLFFLLVFCQTAAQAQAPEGYKLAWSDEFNSASLNTSIWKYRIGKGGTSYQRAENVILEDGKVRINLKKEPYQGEEYTGGGIITKTPQRYGYYEVRVKIDGGYGWHESFWTSWMSGFEDQNPAYKNMDKLEIDCFERYAEYKNNYFTYGAIQWSPLKGNANRDYLTVKENLSTSYVIFGFEFTPDYLNYYYNGTCLKTVDARNLPKHDFYLWLSCIATKPDATDSGAVFFDYLRSYKISPANYKIRKTHFIDYLNGLKGPLHSSGTDLWIEAEDFKFANNWTKELDDNQIVLKGFIKHVAGRDSSQLKATTGIKVNAAGTYTLWVRARDFKKMQGTRKFKVIVNGKEAGNVFGNHGTEGYAWQNGGTFYLPAGTTQLDLYDSSQQNARCDKLLLTTDSTFVPSGTGAQTNVAITNKRKTK